MSAFTHIVLSIAAGMAAGAFVEMLYRRLIEAPRQRTSMRAATKELRATRATVRGTSQVTQVAEQTALQGGPNAR